MKTRLLLYWMLSILGAGTTAGLAKFPTYAGNIGSFGERFALYTIPIPMALGMFHLPTLAVGSVICLLVNPARAKSFCLWLGCAFALGMVFHLLFALNGTDGAWGLFAFVTWDIGVLAALSYAAIPKRQFPRQ